MKFDRGHTTFDIKGREEGEHRSDRKGSISSPEENIDATAWHGIA